MPPAPTHKPDDTAHAPGRIFSEEFLRVDPGTIADAVRSDGFFSMEKALAPEWLDRLSADVAAHGFAINRNLITGVYAENQYYLNHMMACSRAFVEYVAADKVLSICDELLGPLYRVKAMRYYETYGRHVMQWHTDNKTDRSFAHIPGLIFICYVEDVEDGEFQYVRGSHQWSGERAYSDYSDDFIREKYPQDIVSFKGPRGTIVIYDTYGIHRARPVSRKEFTRKSLFFQVDANMDSAEPVFVNTAYLDKEISPRLAAYLGFGLPSDYSPYPKTGLKTLQMRRLSARVIAGWLAYRPARSLYDMAPPQVKNIIRMLMGKARV